MTETRFPEAVAEALAATGWHEGIRIPEDELLRWYRALGTAGIDIPPGAIMALWEFGGMTVHQYGPGVDMSRMPFRIDPLVGLYAGDVLAAYGAALGRPLTPIGEYDLGRGRLAMDPQGAVYVWWGDLWKVADTFDGALIALIEGRRPTRIDLTPAPAPLPPRPIDEREARDKARRHVVGGGPNAPVDFVMTEFESGWLVQAIHANPDPLANLGSGQWIVDRRNGRVTIWPSLPEEMVLDLFRERYADA
ncbi:SUKH-3 domain-containing protein [Embleya sp. NBC_00896]|uniref:SUKH-3 domain-containing protein n=1 Tax=Embleya sp. NBC_00896 TaxID=2975961 RepID=UPI00386B1E9B|nr:SUKH-3 domain-containing protein [Embleya sp. NBC_00896]